VAWILDASDGVLIPRITPLARDDGERERLCHPERSRGICTASRYATKLRFQRPARQIAIIPTARRSAVMQIVRGRDVGWKPQQRDADGIRWNDAFRGMAPQMLAGVGFTAALCFRPDLAVSFAPIVLPLLFAAPLAVWTSRRGAGDALARAGYLVTPEDGAVSATPAVRAFGGYRTAEAT
jgi:hypothetical protein